MPLIEPGSFRGSRNGPDNIAAAKVSWQAADNARLREDAQERTVIRDLLEHGCPPACLACVQGIHEDEPCSCCGHTEDKE